MFSITFFKKSFHLRQLILLFIVVPMITVFFAYSMEQQSRDKSRLYSAAIIDQDNSPLSLRLQEEMSSYGELDLTKEESLSAALTGLSRSKYHVVYVIHPGFEANLRQGKMDKALTSYVEIHTASSQWINDQISLRVLRLWSYYHMLDKILEIDPSVTEAQYDKEYRANLSQSQILTLKVQTLEVQALDNQAIEAQSPEKNTPEDLAVSTGQFSIFNIVFLFLWLYIFIFLAMSSVGKAVSHKEKRLIQRLGFYRVSPLQYHGTTLAVFMATALPAFALSLIPARLIQGVSLPVVSVLPLAVLLALVLWILFALLGHFTKSYARYAMATQVILIALILIMTLGVNTLF